MAGIPSTYHLTGLQGMAEPAGLGAPRMSTVTATAPHPPMWSPDNPLFWFGVLLAATLGFVGIAGSVRLGPARARVSIGES